MHFCPRCRFSFHPGCLTKRGYYEESPDWRNPDERGVQMEVALSPLSTPPYVSAAAPFPMPTTDVRQSRREQIPGSLLALARSPMVKGFAAATPKKWSLTGNYAVVTRARETVVGILNSGFDGHDTWRERLNIPKDRPEEQPNLQSWTAPDLGLLCPSCSLPI